METNNVIQLVSTATPAPANLSNGESTKRQIKQTLKDIANSIPILPAELKKFQTTEMLKNWLNDYQFTNIDEDLNIGLELSTEKIIFYEKCKINRFSTIETLKSAIAGFSGIEPDFINLKLQHLPLCSVTFDVQSPRISVFKDGIVRFEINMYEKNHLRLTVEKKVKRATSKIELDVDYIDYLLSKYTQSIKIIIFNLFSKKEERLYFYNWLSFISNTGEKTRNAIILRGVQGTGKNSLADYILSKFFGERYCKTASNDDLKSQFNGIFENLLFVFFNEVRPDFRESSTIYEKLKALITDNSILINEKYIKVRQVDNVSNMMFFTNNAIPVLLEPTDRRYSIFTSNRKLEDKFDKDTIGDIINTIPDEIRVFWEIILNINYDSGIAQKTYNNDEKQIIIQTTTEWVYIVADYLIQKDIEKLTKFIAGDMAVSKISIDLIEETINELKKEINAGYVSSDLLYKIYLAVNGNLIEPAPIDLERLKLFSRKKLARKISCKLGNIKQKKEEGCFKYVWQI